MVTSQFNKTVHYSVAEATLFFCRSLDYQQDSCYNVIIKQVNIMSLAEAFSQWENIKSDLDSGMSVNQITKKYKFSYDTIKNVIDANSYSYDRVQSARDNFYSEEYKNRLVELRKDHTVAEIGKILNRSVTSVRRDLSFFGLTQSADRTDIIDFDVVSDFKSGLTIIEIARKYNASHDTITKRLKKYGISCDRANGIKRHFSRVHESYWNDIKSDLDKGLTVNILVVKYNLSPDSIHRLIKDHGYKYKQYGAFDYNELIRRVSLAKGKELLFLQAIKDYYDTYQTIPVTSTLADFVKKDRDTIRFAVYRYNAKDFVGNTGYSSGVISLVNFLNKHNIKYRLNDRTVLVKDDGSRQEIDIYLPDFKLGIEVNPTFTHSCDTVKPYGCYDRLYHQNKSLLAEKNGIGLLQVYDDDFLDTKKQDVLLRQLSAMFKPKIKIGARKCIVSDISAKECNLFLEKYHFQGGENVSKIRKGLFYDNKLIGIMSVGNSRYAKADYEIIRYCIRPDYIIMGGFDKLFKSIFDGLQSCKIVSYMDLNKRMSCNNTYSKHGFVFDGLTPPDYIWSTPDGKDVLLRYQTTKQKLVEMGFDEKKSEIDIMLDRGYVRVFRSGSKRYIFTI